MSSAGIIHFIYNETIVSKALPSSSVDYNWFTGINVWNLRFTCGIHHVLLGKLWLTVYTCLIFFDCWWRYWGFICAAIFKIRLSESSIFRYKNFSGEFLYDFKISNDSKILIFGGSCSDLINLIFASSGKQCFSEIVCFFFFYLMTSEMNPFGQFLLFFKSYNIYILYLHMYNYNYILTFDIL